MKKLLFWGDSPCSSTGFSRVSSHVLKSLYDTGEYEITVVAINHNRLWYDQKEFPYKIFPAVFGASGDEYGIEILKGMLETQTYDIFYALNDTDVLSAIGTIVEAARVKNPAMKIVFYCPIDNDLPVPIHRTAATLCDKMVLYTEFAKKIMDENYPETKEKTSIIPHGTDTDTYKQIPAREREVVRDKAFKIKSDKTFLVLNVNRNQWRKDFFRTIWGFLLFWQKHPDSKLYMHCKINDVGGDLLQIIGAVCLWLKIDPKTTLEKAIILHPGFNELQGVSEDRLNQIYNAADVYVSTTLGEGWGLPVTESMAAETPVVVPDNTSLTEIVGQDRGYLVKNGAGPNDWLVPYGYSTQPRPTVDINDFVEKLETVYNNRQDAKLKAHRARKWCKERTWAIVGNMWIKLFKEL